MSVIKQSIKQLSQDLLAKPLLSLTENEKNQLIKLGLLNEDTLEFLRANSLLHRDSENNKSSSNASSRRNDDNSNISYSLNLEGHYGNNAERASSRIDDNKNLISLKKQSKEEAKESDKKENENQIQQIGINKDDIGYGEYGEGHSSGSHGGDPIGSTTPDKDVKDHGADSLLAWAKQNAKNPDSISLHDRFALIKDQGDKVNKYTDGQGIAQLGSSAGTGLNDQSWFALMRMQGDQFIGLARSSNPNLSDQEARSIARQLLITRLKDYTSAGIQDGNLIGILIGKGLTAEQYNQNPEEKARYDRYLKAKSGSYDWSAMLSELSKNGVSADKQQKIEDFTGMDRRNANLFTENLFYESYQNTNKLFDDLHYFQDKAIGFNLIFACDPEQDHNGALHMNHGSITGLAADDKNPTIVLSPRNEEDMMKMIFRLSFIPKDRSIKGSDWLNRSFNPEERALMSMLSNTKLSSQDRIKQFNDYLDRNNLEKNIGVANYMLKGHGWSGGIALFNQGTYDNNDKGLMALMGLAGSSLVGQMRVHHQSCSNAEGGDNSNVAVENDTINDFAPATTKVVSVGAQVIHWNGQGEHYQNVSYIHGNFVNEGQITEKIYYERQGLNRNFRSEEVLANQQWTKNSDGIIVKKAV